MFRGILRVRPVIFFIATAVLFSSAHVQAKEVVWQPEENGKPILSIDFSAAQEHIRKQTVQLTQDLVITPTHYAVGEVKKATGIIRSSISRVSASIEQNVLQAHETLTLLTPQAPNLSLSFSSLTPWRHSAQITQEQAEPSPVDSLPPQEELQERIQANLLAQAITTQTLVPTSAQTPLSDRESLKREIVSEVLSTLQALPASYTSLSSQAEINLLKTQLRNELRSLVSRQSDSDTRARTTVIQNITNTGTLTSPSISGATITSSTFSGTTGTFASLTSTTGTFDSVCLGGECEASWPATTLWEDDVDGAGFNLTNVLGFEATRATTTSATSTNLYFSNSLTGPGSFSVNSDGDVGIGTTAPGSTLSVSGSATIGSAYSSTAAPTNGLLVEGSVGIGTNDFEYITGGGETWTSRTAAADQAFYTVGYGNGLFVALSSTDTDRIMTSPDGITWTQRTDPTGANDHRFYDVVYAEDQFVAVSGWTGSSNTLATKAMTSSDGITWTLRSTPATASTYSFAAITHGEGLYVAVAYDGTTGYRAMTSPDGITWTLRATPADNQWYAVAYGNGTFVATATTGTGNRVMTSPDGITWTIGSMPEDKGWSNLVFAEELFVALASSGEIATSPDGITWTSHPPIVSTAWYDIVYGNGDFVAVAYGPGSTYRAATSPNGIDWTLRIPAAQNNWTGLAYGNETFVATSLSGTGSASNRVMTSPTGSVTTPHKLSVSGTASLSSGTSWTSTSDARLKDVTADLYGSSMERVRLLRPIEFKWNELHAEKFGGSTSKTNYGFIAQEVEQIFPSFITTDSQGYKWYNPSGFEALLTASVQELDVRLLSIESLLGVSATSTSTTTPVTDSSGLLDTLIWAGMQLFERSVKVVELVAERIIAEEVKTERLILTDEDTGEEYCVRIKSGQIVADLGGCATAIEVNSDSSIESTETEEETSTTTEEVIEDETASTTENVIQEEAPITKEETASSTPAE